MNTFLALLFTLLAIPSQYRMMVVSDPHVLDQSLFNVNSASMQNVIKTSTIQGQYAQAAFTSLIDKALIEKPNVVLIPGDMTYNGSKVDHLTVANQLRRLKNAGIPVCLIPGDHDIYNYLAASYLGAEAQPIANIDDAEFDSIYAFLNESWPSLRQDPNSHSYVVTIAPRLTLIGADCTHGYADSEAVGEFYTPTLKWILQQADSAKAKGDRVIAMMHYQLLEHFDDKGTLLAYAMVNNYDNIAQAFYAHGIDLVLTGHMHIDNVTTKYMSEDLSKSIVEIATGSPVLYPNPYRMITASDTWSKLVCETRYITSLSGYSDFSSDNNKAVAADRVQTVMLPKLYDMGWDYIQHTDVDSLIDNIELNATAEWFLDKIFGLGKSDMKDLANAVIGVLAVNDRTAYLNRYLGADASESVIIHYEANEGNKNTEALKKDIIDQIYALVKQLINDAYSGDNTKRNNWLKKAKTIYQIVSPYESHLIYGKVDAVKELKATIKDYLDGVFGDYTRYKEADQNRTDDLTPNLQFAALPHRDYYATVSFDMKGHGTAIEAVKVLINEPAKITRPKDPTAAGWAFRGWYSDEELTKEYDFNTLIDADDDVTMTLFAKWVPVITCTLGDNKKMYDGKPLEPLFKYQGVLPKSYTIKIEVDTILTHVDSVAYHVTNTTIWNGTNDVTANYSVEWNTNAAWMVIQPRHIQIATASESKLYDGQPLRKDSCTISGDGFVAGEGIQITYTGALTYVGKANNTISYTANEGTRISDYQIKVTEGLLTVNPTNVSVALRDSMKMYDGKALEAMYDVEGMMAVGDTMIVTIDNHSITDAGSVTAEITGVRILNADQQDMTNQYKVAIAQGKATLDVTQRSVEITTGSDSKVYDGTPLKKDSCILSGDGFVEGEGIDIIYTSSVTKVDTIDNAIEYTAKEGTNLDNYEFIIVPGQLVITPASLAIALRDSAKLYDGDAMLVRYEVEGVLADGDTLIVDIENESITDVGTQTARIAGLTVLNTTKEDVTDQYVITMPKRDATLRVNRRIIDILTVSATKTYDGMPLTKDSIIVTGDGFVDGEGMDVTYLGAQTYVGTCENTITYEPQEGTKLENYDIVVKTGHLTVTPVALSIALRDTTKMYDGLPLEARYQVEGAIVEGEQLFVTMDTAITNVDTMVVGIKDLRIMRGEENTTNQYTIKYVKDIATLIILSREITIGSASDSKIYDGIALTKDSVWIDGEFADGEGLIVHATGSQMYVGTSANTIDYTANEGTLLENYVITTNPGQLEITPAELSLSLQDASKMYDGDTLRAEYTLEGNLAVGDDVKVYLSNNEIVNADTMTTILDSVVILNAAKENVTNQYTITPTTYEATLIITPRSIEITTGSASGIYNGVALTNQDTTMVGDGFVEGEGVAVTFTGTVTKVDTVANTMTYEALEGTNLANYVITIKTGSLVVTQRPLTINMDADQSKMYDGIALEATYQVDGELASGDSLTVTIENGTRINAGTDMAAITYLSIKNAALEDVTSQYAISSSKIKQTLEITKRSIEITTASAEKEYDGEALVADSMMLTAGDGFVEGEGIVVTAWGSQIEEGSLPNTIDYVAQEGTNLNNYDITIIEGTLTITPKAVIPTNCVAPSSLDRVEKFILNEKLYIRKGGVLYDVTGKIF